MAEVRLRHDLRDYLRAVIDRRFDWSTLNCFTFCADWVKGATGRDPAAPWRGLVRSKAEADILLRNEGGPVALARKAMRGIDLPIVEYPMAGDVAMVLTAVNDKGAHRPTGAICVGNGRFAVLAVEGLVVVPMTCLRAWSIHVE